MCKRFSYQVPYGVVYGNEYASKIVEKPINQFLINSIIYIISRCCKPRRNNDAPFDMPYIINKRDENQIVGKYHLQDFWYDIGTINDLKK